MAFLLISGCLGLLAIAMPSLVVIGFILLILPGLILSLAPAAFLYGLAFGGFRLWLDRFLTGGALNLASAVLTLALFWAIPQYGLMQAEKRLAAAVQEDVTPPGPIVLAGHIRVERPFESRCDSLCTALLVTPGVTGVTIAAGSSEHVTVTTWRIVPADAPGEAVQPEGYGFDAPDSRPVAGDWLAGPRALEAAWNLRMAEGFKLVKGEDDPPADFTIARHNNRSEQLGAWSLLPSGVFRQSAEIRDHGGRVLFRRQLTSVSAPDAPLHTFYEGGKESGRIAWGRRTLRWPSGSSYYAELDFPTLLLPHVTIARGVDREAVLADARTQLISALDDPGRKQGDPGLLLANQWMNSFNKAETVSEADAALVRRIVADQRIVDAEGLYEALEAMGDAGLPIRRLIEVRLLDPETARENRPWGRALAALPPGTFTEQTPEERIILANPDLSRYANAIIKRQADRGAAALPDLVRLLEEHATADPGENGYGDAGEAIDSIRGAFRALGPAAAPALPQVEVLFARHERLRRARDRDWEIALIVMGMPSERVIKPENMSGTQEAYARRVVEAARRPYDPKRDW